MSRKLFLRGLNNAKALRDGMENMAKPGNIGGGPVALEETSL